MDTNVVTVQSNNNNNTKKSKSTAATIPITPLLPDHIREALRRYKKDKEGGGAGLKALSLSGMGVGAGASPGGRFPTATGGRRIFR